MSSKTLKEKLKVDLQHLLKEINKRVYKQGVLKIREEHSEEKGSYVFVEFVEDLMGIAKRERKVADIEIENQVVKMYDDLNYGAMYNDIIGPVYSFLRKFIQENGLKEETIDGRF